MDAVNIKTMTVYFRFLMNVHNMEIPETEIPWPDRPEPATLIIADTQDQETLIYLEIFKIRWSLPKKDWY